MINKDELFKKNNLNLIRLFAAAQVVHAHLISIFKLEMSEEYRYFFKLLGFFPGVPVFFFISGYLISKSWETSSSLKSYVQKRIARIEPALITSVVFALFLTYTSGYFDIASQRVSTWELLALIFAKISILQFYNPDYLRAYGDGVLNGSLWTITVEIQFYFLIPIIYSLILNKNKHFRLIVLIVLFLLISRLCHYLYHHYGDAIPIKLLNVSFLPWLYMFACGIFFQRNFMFFFKHLNGKFLHCLILYIAAGLIGLYLQVDFSNSLNPLLFCILACLIFSASYSRVNTANFLLGKVDISYGLYLYHMPIINYFIFIGFSPTYQNGVIILVCVVISSLLSWFVIEKPCLSLAKKN